MVVPVACYRLTASILIAGLFLPCVGFAQGVTPSHTQNIIGSVPASMTNYETVELSLPEPSGVKPSAGRLPQRLAHAECGNVEFQSAIVANTLVRDVPPGRSAADAMTDSLFLNLALSMAYQRDPELARLSRKLGRLNTGVTISAFALSGLGLAASTISLATINGSGVHTEHEGEHAAEPRDNPSASVIGVVSSGLSIATLATQAVMRRRYGKQLTARQSQLKQQVLHAVSHLEDPVHFAQLEALTGPRAAKEYRQLIRRLDLADPATVMPDTNPHPEPVSPVLP